MSEEQKYAPEAYAFAEAEVDRHTTPAKYLEHTRNGLIRDIADEMIYEMQQSAKLAPDGLFKFTEERIDPQWVTGHERSKWVQWLKVTHEDVDSYIAEMYGEGQRSFRRGLDKCW